MSLPKTYDLFGQNRLCNVSKYIIYFGKRVIVDHLLLNIAYYNNLFFE